ncbi:MAG TPA: serine/threonine-protein kinase [Polyangiaceae bacterium]|nr:serine/threonine-protein kinase [Polyangiaceae bacterium]
MTQPIPFSELAVVPESRSKPISSRGLRFLCRLGQGGMAEVHLANAAPPSAPPSLVVVKRMHLQHVDDSSTVRMFLDEARLALRLSHPNIVRTDRLGSFDGRHGIVMEFLEGQPFHQVLKRAYETEATLSLEVVVQIAIAALDGLHYAHELKDQEGQPLSIVHRDVSPQNLFITYDGAVKLLDFGIAKNALQDGRTRTGLLKGKVSYMAPEQARGDDLDRRADIWSLGVVLWEAVTGSRLFKGSNEAATLNMTLTDDVPPPSLRRPDLPLELEAILLRALKRDPAQRYASAAVMRDELEAWLSNRELMPSASVSQLMPRLFGKEMREHRQQIQTLLHAPAEPTTESGVTLIASQPGGSRTFSSLHATQVSSVTDLMEELTRQRRVTTRLLGGLLVLVGAALLGGLYLMLQRPAAMAPMPAGWAEKQAATAPVAATTPSRAAEVASQQAAAPVAAAAVATASSAAAGSSRWPASARSGKPGRQASASAPAGGVATEAPPLSPSPAPVPPTPVEMGRLNLDTTPWAIVSEGGRVLGQTPLVGVPLPAGTHTLVLSNPEQGLKTAYQVTISAGQVTSRRVGLD